MRIITEKGKRILEIDLSARLPYGVKYRKCKCDSQICTLKPEDLKNGVERFEPYLRPLSSMTEEEKEELKIVVDNKFTLSFDGTLIKNLKVREVPTEWTTGSFTQMVNNLDIANLIDWIIEER